MFDNFQVDVFLSHCGKDKALVQSLGERLRNDVFKMSFDDGMLKASDSIPAKIEGGPDPSRVLPLCMSVGNPSARRLVERSGVTDLETKAALTFAGYRRTFV